MLRRVQKSHRAASSAPTSGIDTIKAQIEAKLRGGNIDAAVAEAVSYIKSVAKTPAEKSRLQDLFNNAMGGINARGNYYQFCLKLAESRELQEFKPDNTPPLFIANTEPDVKLYAAAQFDASTGHDINFNRTDMNVVTSTTFTGVSANAKVALRALATLSGRVLSADGQYTGSCLRLSEDLVIMPLHCVPSIGHGIIQFPTSDVKESRTIHIAASDIEAYENVDIAVVRLREKQESVTIKFSDTVLDGELLFLLHRPAGEGNDVLQVSANTAQLATWDGYSLVTSHDSSDGSSGGIYVNTSGEVVALHMGVSRIAPMMFGRQAYAYLFAGVVLSIDADSKIYDFLELEGPKAIKKALVPIKTETKLDVRNTKSFTIDASKCAASGSLLSAITQSLRTFYSGTPTHEFCSVQVDNVNYTSQSGENFTLRFAIVARASDKYLAGVEVSLQAVGAATPPNRLQIGDSINGYNQVLRIEYPKDATKFLWINSHMFSPDLMGEIVENLFQTGVRPEHQQEVFDYCIQLLEIAKMPIAEHLTNIIVTLEIQLGARMLDVLHNPTTYTEYAGLFGKVAFIIGRVKLNHSKLSKLFSQTPPISLNEMMIGLNRELDNAKNLREFTYDMILPVLRLLNIIDNATFDSLLGKRETIDNAELLSFWATHEQAIRDLFTPKIMIV